MGLRYLKILIYDLQLLRRSDCWYRREKNARFWDGVGWSYDQKLFRI